MTDAGDTAARPSLDELAGALGRAIIALADAAAEETVADRAEKYANAAHALAQAAAAMSVRPHGGSS